MKSVAKKTMSAKRKGRKCETQTHWHLSEKLQEEQQNAAKAKHGISIAK